MKEKLRISITSYIHFLVDFTCAYWMFYLMMRQYRLYYDYSVSPVGETLVDSRLGWTLIYNFCAFALQLPVGWLVDRFMRKRSWWISSLGCLILAITGVLIYGESFLQAMDVGFHQDDLGRIQLYYSDLHGICYSILLGIGNALFHVGAGVEVLHLSAKGGRKRVRHWRGEIAAIDHTEYRMALVGIFVSTGALGLYLGQIISWHLESVSVVISDYFQVRTVYSLLIIGLMLVAAGLNLAATKPVKQYHRKEQDVLLTDCSVTMAGETSERDVTDKREQLSERGGTDKSVAWDPRWNTGIILLLFLVVVLRSFQGGIMDFQWYSWWSFTSFVFAVCIMLGKALGGILADRIGVLWTVLVPLACSAILLRFASDYMIPGLIAVLLFQTTMPITLSLMHRQMPRHPGMAFGLLSFGLFLGTLPKLGYNLWDDKQGVSPIRYQVLYFLQDNLDNICSMVAFVSVLLLLIALFIWRHAWKGKND